MNNLQVAVSSAQSDHHDIEQECVRGIVGRAQVQFAANVDEVRQQVVGIKANYDSCNTNPIPAERDACLQVFAATAREVSNNLFPEVAERRENFTLYVLNGLINYHECRLDQHSAPSARDAREVLCALYFYNEFNYRFETYLTTAENTWFRLVYRFLECGSYPDYRQPRCFMDTAEELYVAINTIYNFFVDNEEYIIELSDPILDNYHECRKL